MFCQLSSPSLDIFCSHFTNIPHFIVDRVPSQSARIVAVISWSPTQQDFYLSTDKCNLLTDKYNLSTDAYNLSTDKYKRHSSSSSFSLSSSSSSPLPSPPPPRHHDKLDNGGEAELRHVADKDSNQQSSAERWPVYMRRGIWEVYLKALNRENRVYSTID